MQEIVFVLSVNDEYKLVVAVLDDKVIVNFGLSLLIVIVAALLPKGLALIVNCVVNSE